MSKELEEFLTLKKALASKQRDQDRKEGELEVLKKALLKEFNIPLEKGQELLRKLRGEQEALEREFATEQEAFKAKHGEALGL